MISAASEDDAGVPARLALFRSEWPDRASWQEVREYEPRALVDSVKGALFGAAAVILTGACVALVVAPEAAVHALPVLDWAFPFALMLLLLGGLALWIAASVYCATPFEARRAIAMTRFARARDLAFARYGPMPERRGVLFAEGSAPQLPARVIEERRRRGVRDPARVPLFNAEFALWRPRADDPVLQIAKATYRGSKSDPKGPRSAFRYLELQLPRQLPNLMIDARGNASLVAFLTGKQRLSLEGDFDRFFTVYAPTGYERDALELLTPDVMACLIDHGRAWDIEVVDDRLIAASRRFRGGSDREECTAMLFFAELVLSELGDQADSYTDPRSARPRTRVSSAGLRLRRRGAAWTTTVFLVIAAGMLTLPHLLGWWLDR